LVVQKQRQWLENKKTKKKQKQKQTKNVSLKKKTPRLIHCVSKTKEKKCWISHKSGCSKAKTVVGKLSTGQSFVELCPVDISHDSLHFLSKSNREQKGSSSYTLCK
jgi:hypothetical protein